MSFSRHPLASLAVLAAALLSAAACRQPPSPPPNVLLISADSLRADRLQLWRTDGGGVATPQLERLARGGLRWRNAWAVAPWTAPSMVSVLTGLYPTSHGVVNRDDTTPPALPTLPRLLEARGYRLGNFTFFAQLSYFHHLGLGPSDPNLLSTTVPGSFTRWLADGDPGQPFFAWVHLLEPHLPYGATGYAAPRVQVAGSSGLEATQLQATVPIGTVSFADGDRERLLALYDQDVAALDAAIGEVLDALAARQREANTLVVFVADHGEELLEYGWVGHASTAVEARLVPEVLRVPMLLAGPGVPAGAVSDELVQQVDLLPTVARLLDLPLPQRVDGLAIGPGWFRSSWQSGRRTAFFDSSAGGNLTPLEQREERWQGATDGTCLLTTHLLVRRPEQRATQALAADGCDEARRGQLEGALASWRRQQTEARLAVLESAAAPAAPLPDRASADQFIMAIKVVNPSPEQRLDYVPSAGQVMLEWNGEGTDFWVEYEVGLGADMVRGSFAVAQRSIVFGPFPEGFWNELARHSPFRFRLIDAQLRQRSQWRHFTINPVP